MRLKIRVNEEGNRGDRPYPGWADEQLRLLGLTNSSISYADLMPIYGDATPEQYETIRGLDWVESVEIVVDGATGHR